MSAYSSFVCIFLSFVTVLRQNEDTVAPGTTALEQMILISTGEELGGGVTVRIIFATEAIVGASINPIALITCDEYHRHHPRPCDPIEDKPHLHHVHSSWPIETHQKADPLSLMSAPQLLLAPRRHTRADQPIPDPLSSSLASRSVVAPRGHTRAAQQIPDPLSSSLASRSAVAPRHSQPSSNNSGPSEVQASTEMSQKPEPQRNAALATSIPPVDPLIHFVWPPERSSPPRSSLCDQFSDRESIVFRDLTLSPPLNEKQRAAAEHIQIAEEMKRELQEKRIKMHVPPHVGRPTTGADYWPHVTRPTAIPLHERFSRYFNDNLC